MPASQHVTASVGCTGGGHEASLTGCTGAGQATAAARVAATAAAAAPHDPAPTGYDLEAGLLWDASP